MAYFVSDSFLFGFWFSCVFVVVVVGFFLFFFLWLVGVLCFVFVLVVGGFFLVGVGGCILFVLFFCLFAVS